MKIRNKKTGEVVVVEGVFEVISPQERIGELMPKRFIAFTSLAALNDKWEDYVPKEPLIKDEKIRKVVRAWADAVGREKLLVIKSAGRLEVSDGSPHLIYISFHADEDTLKSLDNRTYYTIAELCGEEE